MRIFLAGATGVLGRRIVPLLLALGHHVTGITRDKARARRLRGLGADAVVCDVLDGAGIAHAVSAAAPDLVLHQLTDLRTGSLADNAALRITGTHNLVEAALDAGVQHVVAQSIAWAYAPGPDPAAEDVPLDLDADRPRRTTIEGIRALESSVHRAEHWVVLRYGLLYGPDTWYGRQGARAEDARHGTLIADHNVASFVHVDDAAAAAAVQALSWPSGVVNICDDEPAAGSAWVPVFCRAVGAEPPTLAGDEPRAGFARGADNSHARGELNWTPRWKSWRAGFAAMATLG